MIEYRVMTIEDYDGVYHVWDSSPEMSINTTDDSREGIAKFIRRNPETSFVALDGEKVVGVILAGHDGRRGNIEHMTVLPEYRKQRIAATLVDRCLEAMDREGIAKVFLLAYKLNTGANAFWESVGFDLREDLNYRNKTIRELEYRPNPFRNE